MTTPGKGRPAHKPGYLITIEGRTISPELDARLESLTLVDSRGTDSDQLDITLVDHDGKLAIPPRGAVLQLEIGWQDQGLVDRGTFVVDEVEHAGAPDRLTIRARAADMRQALPGRRSQSWHETRIGAIVDSIAERNGLQARTSAELAAIDVEHIDQTDESDMHFLTRLAQRHDATATVKAGNLLFIPKGRGRTAGGQSIPSIRLQRHAGDSHRFNASDRNAFTGVIAWWHNQATAEREKILIGSDERPQHLRGNYATAADARAEANAAYQRILRKGASFSIDLAEGRADLFPETPVAAQGFKPEIDAIPWLITEVRHTLTSESYTGSVSMEVLGEARAADDESEEEDVA